MKKLDAEALMYIKTRIEFDNPTKAILLQELRRKGYVCNSNRPVGITALNTFMLKNGVHKPVTPTLKLKGLANPNRKISIYTVMNVNEDLFRMTDSQLQYRANILVKAINRGVAGYSNTSLYQRLNEITKHMSPRVGN